MACEIFVIGAPDCEDTARVEGILGQNGITFSSINIGTKNNIAMSDDPTNHGLLLITDGAGLLKRTKIPNIRVVDTQSGDLVANLIEPSDDDLSKVLASYIFITKH